MSETIYSRMLYIHEFLNEENYDMTYTLDTSKYIAFQQWSHNNGCIFSNNITFPIAFGPFGYLGVKSLKEINENEALLFISKKQMILSKELKQLYPFISNVLVNKEDEATLILTLFLIDEDFKGNDSFYKPYLDLFPHVDFIYMWDNSSLLLLDDENIIKSINKFTNDIKEIYLKLIKLSQYEKLTFEKFQFYYFHVLSRKFYIDDTCTALFPLAELFNHENVNTKFEFFDSENFVYKNTESFSNKNTEFIQTTKSDIIPVNNISYNPNEELQNPDDDDDISNEETLIHIKENDYFVISTSNGQLFTKGEQCFIKYCQLSNKKELVHYGFNSLINEDDNTIFYINIDKNDKGLTSYMEKCFSKHLNNNTLKIKVKFRKVCDLLLKYFRVLYFYSQNPSRDEPPFYTFQKDIELKILDQSIEILTSKLNELNSRYHLEKDLEYLEEEMNMNDFKKMNQRDMNIIIYRIRKRVNLAHQIDLMKCIREEITKRDNVKDYLLITNSIIKSKNISEYDDDSNSIKKILKFIGNQPVNFNLKY